MSMNSPPVNPADPGPGLHTSVNATAAANQFVLEAAFLATSLDAISMREKKGRIAEEVETAFESYEKLLRRRASLRLTGEDDAAVRQILQRIRRRLNYLRAWRMHSSCDPQPTGE